MGLFRFLRALLQWALGVSVSSEISSLQARLVSMKSARDKFSEKSEALMDDIRKKNQEIEGLISASKSADDEACRTIYDLKCDRETLRDGKQALLEELEELQLSLAKANSQITLDQLEKEQMAGLLEVLRERTNATIAFTRDSYANPQRPQHHTE